MITAEPKSLLLQFANADTSRRFNFSSGNFGALPLQGFALASILKPISSGNLLLLLKLLLLECLATLMQTVLPFKHAVLITRTILRSLLKKRPLCIHALSVVSIGNGLPSKDPYFGKLLSQLDQPFNYITIVGGNSIKSHNCRFVEEALSPLQLAWIFLSFPLQTPLLACQLVHQTLDIKGWHARLIFLIFGFREIHMGTALTQKIITRAICAHLRTGAVSSVLFPMEGRNWEKNITRFANCQGIRSTGYLHCALTPRHFSLLDSRFLCIDERPHRIVAPSEMAYGLLKRSYGEITYRGYFLRGSNDHTPTTSLEKCLLFSLIGDIHESEIIIRHVASLCGNIEFPIVIRLNPNTSSYKHLSKLVLSHGLSLYDPKCPMEPFISFSRSSSVIVEYLRQNVKSVYLALDEPVSNNIFELDNKFGVEQIQVNTFFRYNILRMVTNTSRFQKFDGKTIAAYYLDEGFTASELPRCIF